MITGKLIQWSAGCILAVGLLIAQSAAAGPLTMVGEWFMNRGPLVDIPANGGPVFCGGPNAILSGCVSNLRPLNGGIPAGITTVSAMGSNPASFTVPTGAFGLSGGPANRQTVPVNGIPTVIQLASQFSIAAPVASSTNNGATMGIVPAGLANFQANAWVNDPIQTAGGPATLMGGGGGVPRLASNFTWCPPTGACTTTTMFTTMLGPITTMRTFPVGPIGARIKYTSGASKFGGTMNMMLRNTGVVSIKFGPSAVLHQLVGGTSNPDYGKQVAGGGYANFRQLTLAPGPVYSTYMINTPCTTGLGVEPNPPGCGIISAQGTQTMTLPGSMNYDWGMPWTTGTITVDNAPGAVPSQDPATRLTAMGGDSRTALGAGRITMVAGGTTERAPSGNHFAALEVLNLKFGSTSQVPFTSWPTLIAMVALLTLAGGYMARHRLAGEG